MRGTFEKKKGYREGLTIKTEKSPTDVVNHGIVQSRWSVTSDVDLYKNPVIVPENEHTSIFHISISNPHYGNEFLSAPIVFVEDDDIVDIQLRGEAQTGGLATIIPFNLILIYDWSLLPSTFLLSPSPLYLMFFFYYFFFRAAREQGILKLQFHWE